MSALDDSSCTFTDDHTHLSDADNDNGLQSLKVSVNLRAASAHAIRNTLPEAFPVFLLSGFDLTALHGARSEIASG